jgi:hypothetical protein
LLRNGSQVTGQIELAHLDRLVIGASQYYLIAIPSKSTPKDPYYTFEMMQDEIASKSGYGLSKEIKANMTQGKIINLIC